MNKTKILVLTKVETRPNEIGQKKIDDAVAKQKEADEDGLTEDFYDRLGITPSGKHKSDIDANGMLFLEENELEEVMFGMLLDLASFDTCEDDDMEGSLITLKNRRTFSVLEDTEQVYAQIYVLNQTWYERLQDRIQIFINKFKRAPKDGNNN
jgi:hypothetical protein